MKTKLTAAVALLLVLFALGFQTGLIKSASDGSLDVDTRAAFIRVKESEVSGKLIVVIPFFGTLFNIVGL